MIEQINEILEEIFLIDPDLRKYRSELRKIMNDLIEQKPDTKFDEAFKEELKLKLLVRAEELIEEQKGKKLWFKDLFVPRNMSFAFAGAAMSLVIMIPVFISFIEGNDKFAMRSFFETQDKNIVFESGVINVISNAFGDLANNQESEFFNEDDAVLQTADRGGSSAVGITKEQSVITSPENVFNFFDNETTESIEPMVMTDSKMIAPYNTVEYKYIYSGEEFKLNSKKLLVYKKVLNRNNGEDIDTVLKKFDFGVMNLKQFKNIKVNQISLAEEKEFGFRININLEASQISIYQNWEMWPRPDKDCRDEKCFMDYRLKVNDVPDDKKIIALADGFVEKLGLDMSFYGKPQVQSYWKDNLKRGVYEKNIWIPEEMNVIYPLKFDNKIVYDTSGNVNGLSVNVNIRHMKASGAHQIGAQKYQSSEYEAVTDIAVVMNEIENGGFMNNQWYRDDVLRKVVEVELATPTLGLIRHYKYFENKGETEELFVPALIFPIEKISDDQVYYNRKAVVVPLIKELLEEDKGGNAGGRPEPMLMIER